VFLGGRATRARVGVLRWSPSRLDLRALTVRHDETFVTFDGSVVVDALRGAGKRHLVVL